MNGRRHDNGKGSEADETDRSRGNGEPRGDDRSPNRYRKALSVTELLRRQFRRVALSLTGRADEDERIKRHRTEQPGGGARPSISVRIPPAAIAAVACHPETLDCLNPFHGGMDSFFEYDEEYQHIDQNQLFPDLEL
jgi:hypothetical protein